MRKFRFGSPSSFFFFFSLMHNSKVYSIYVQSGHQTTALLSKIFLFLVRAACELRSASYGPKRTSHRLSCTPFCAYMHNSKTKGQSHGRLTYSTIALLSEISILLVRAVCTIPSTSYGFKHAWKPLCNTLLCTYLH